MLDSKTRWILPSRDCWEVRNELDPLALDESCSIEDEPRIIAAGREVEMNEPFGLNQAEEDIQAVPALSW